MSTTASTSRKHAASVTQKGRTGGSALASSSSLLERSAPDAATARQSFSSTKRCCWRRCAGRSRAGLRVQHDRSVRGLRSDEMIDRVFAVMAMCPHHTFQVLTKRPKRMREFIAAHWRNQVELEAEAIRPSKGLRSRRNGVLNLRRRRLGRKRPRIRVSATSAYAGPQGQSVSATISY
jgi:Protein of unknown function (DUF5131)